MGYPAEWDACAVTAMQSSRKSRKPSSKRTLIVVQEPKLMPDFSVTPVRTDKPDWWTGDEWMTPPDFVAQLEAEFGAFDLDPCAREASAQAPYYYTKEDDGLAQPWHGHVFVNPPYSKPGPWVAKALAEAERATTILLLPAATDVGWFHDLLLVHANIRFVRGRIRFLGWRGTPIGSPTAGSLIARIPLNPAGDRRFHL
jgi:site-specific DNA-methyltransferase (adenine-specific)